MDDIFNETHDMAIQAWSQSEQLKSDTGVSNSKVTSKALSSFVELQLKVVKGSYFVK